MGLRELRRAQGWNHDKFIEEFEKTAKLLKLGKISISPKTLQRWETGTPPPHPHPTNMRVLQAMFNCSMAELGWPDCEAHIPESEQDWMPSSTIDWFYEFTSRSSISRKDFVLSGVGLTLFASRFFTSTLRDVARADATGTKIEMTQVNMLARANDILRQQDTETGSLRHVTDAKKQCKEIFDLLKYSSYNEAVGRRLFVIASDAASFTGWLLFDAGRDPEAQQYLKLALRAATHAEDPISASVATTFMAIQKYNLCQWDDALALANAARKMVVPLSVPHVQASLLTRSARAFAGKGRQRDAYASLDQAFSLFDLGAGDNHPHNVHWVSAGELHGQAAGCALLLDDLDRAEIEFTAAAGHYGLNARRSTSLHMLRLALGYADVGRIEEACATASKALDTGRGVGSYRFEEVKGDLAASLRRQPDTRYVRDFFATHPDINAMRFPRSRLSLMKSGEWRGQ